MKYVFFVKDKWQSLETALEEQKKKLEAAVQYFACIDKVIAVQKFASRYEVNSV